MQSVSELEWLASLARCVAVRNVLYYTRLPLERQLFYTPKQVFVMQIRQISIFLENKPGQLSQICRDLSDSGVNIATLSLADSSDFGIVRMIVDDHEKAQNILTDKGHVVNVCNVVAVGVPDSPGGMAGVTDVLDAAGVNIEYSYAFAFHSGEKAVLVFRFTDNAKAEAALAGAGYSLLAEKEVIAGGKA